MPHGNNFKWHLGYIPSWVVWIFDPHKSDYSQESHDKGFRERNRNNIAIEGFNKRVKGRFYEYAEVVLRLDHTHDNAILKRKLRRRSKCH